MAEIIPAILPKNYEDLKNKISMVRGIAPVAQIDICDGVFVDSITWPFLDGGLDQHFTRIENEQEGLPFWEDIDFELDLMVSDAVGNFDLYNKLGARRLIFHVEAVGEVGEFKHFLEGIDPYVRDIVEIGIAINPDTDAEKIFSFISCVDFVQVMGIEHIGKQGERFSSKSLEQIKKIKAMFDDVIISVDGGVNLENAPEILSAGASRLVAGSAIFKTDDIIERVEQFKNL